MFVPDYALDMQTCLFRQLTPVAPNQIEEWREAVFMKCEQCSIWSSEIKGGISDKEVIRPLFF